MLKAIGRALELIVGFFFWGLILLVVAALVLGSLWLDGAGVEQPAVVAAKYEQISFTHADWTRTFEIGLRREDGPEGHLTKSGIFADRLVVRFG